MDLYIDAPRNTVLFTAGNIFMARSVSKYNLHTCVGLRVHQQLVHMCDHNLCRHCVQCYVKYSVGVK